MNQRILETPLFQVNLLLWGLWEQATHPIAPALWRAGLLLAAIDTPIHPGPDLADRYFDWFGNRSGPSPDVVAEFITPSDPYVIFECKLSSFGLDSSTSQQATKLVAAASSVRTRFGSASESRGVVVAYVIADSRYEPAFLEALASIEAGVRAECEACQHFVYTVVQTAAGIGLRPKGGTAALGSALSGCDVVIVLADDGETAPCPIYIIPFDPDIGYNTERDKQIAENDFLERASVSIAGDVGRATIGSRVVLNLTNHFEQATYGFSRYWRNRDAVQGLKNTIARYVQRRFRGINDPVIVRLESDTIEFVLRTAEQQKDLISQLLIPLPEEDLHQPELPLDN